MLEHKCLSGRISDNSLENETKFDLKTDLISRTPATIEQFYLHDVQILEEDFLFGLTNLTFVRLLSWRELIETLKFSDN